MSNWGITSVDTTMKEEIVSLIQVLRKTLWSEDNNTIISNDIYTRKKEEIKKFLVEEVYPLLLNDEIFPIEKQKEIIEEIMELEKSLEDLLKILWLRNKIVVSFAGRFSAGKSSIINYILGNENLLPVDLIPTTAIPTYITSPPKEIKMDDYKNKFGIVDKNNNLKIAPIELLHYIKKEIIEYIPVPMTSFIKHFVIFPELITDKINQRFPLEKIAIIDTPGYDPGEGKETDRIFTEETLKHSDIVFWIMDIQDGDLSKETVEFLRKILNFNPSINLYVVINKIDTKPPRICQIVRDKVKATLEKYNIPYRKILLFTSKDRRNRYQEYIREFNDEFENLLKEFTKKQLEISHEIFEKLENYLTEARQNIKTKIEEAKKELENLIEESDRTFESIPTDLKPMILKYDEISEIEVEIITDLYTNNEGLSTIIYNVLKLSNLRQRISRKSEEEEYLESLLEKIDKAIKQLEEIRRVEEFNVDLFLQKYKLILGKPFKIVYEDVYQLKPSILSRSSFVISKNIRNTSIIKKISDVAKELGVKSKEIIDFLNDYYPRPDRKPWRASHGLDEIALELIYDAFGKPEEVEEIPFEEKTNIIQKKSVKNNNLEDE